MAAGPSPWTLRQLKHDKAVMARSLLAEGFETELNAKAKANLFAEVRKMKHPTTTAATTLPLLPPPLPLSPSP